MKNDLLKLSAELGVHLVLSQKMLAVAESCTGGLIATLLTEIAGSSAWFDRGFVTYSNVAKRQMLNVQEHTLEKFGAVSAETALEMVSGALLFSEADCAIAVTGIAGPSGGTNDKPVGTVYLAWAIKGHKDYCEHHLYHGDRHQIRLQTAHRAVQYLLETLKIKMLSG